MELPDSSEEENVSRVYSTRASLHRKWWRVWWVRLSLALAHRLADGNDVQSEGGRVRIFPHGEAEIASRCRDEKENKNQWSRVSPMKSLLRCLGNWIFNWFFNKPINNKNSIKNISISMWFSVNTNMKRNYLNYLDGMRVIWTSEPEWNKFSQFFSVLGANATRWETHERNTIFGVRMFFVCRKSIENT